MDNNILAILTTEDRDDIKKALKDIIINQIREDVRGDTYIFDSNDLNDMMQEAITEIKEEIKPILKDFMFNKMKKKLGIE